MRKPLRLLLILLICFACQKPEEEITASKVSILPETFDAAQAGDTLEIMLTANKNWTSTPDADWVGISKTEGEAIKDYEIIELYVAPNPLSTKRVTTVTFLCDQKPVTATISQSKRILVAVNVDNRAQDQIVELLSDEVVTKVSSNQTWVKYDPAKQTGLKPKQHRLSVEAFDAGGSERTATISFFDKSNTLLETAIINQSKAKAVITYSPSTPKPISTSLIGFNTIYSHYYDDFWVNTGIKPALKQMGTHFLRWPGGAPTNRYHWDNLNGWGWRDNWEPGYSTAEDLNPSLYTDLDEHIAICKEVGATPLIGINQGSGLKWNRVNDGIAEAEALVQYIKTKGYDVNHYYLDNEPYHAGANFKMTAAVYAEQINLYAPKIKAINPNAKIIINWQRIQPGSLWTILAAAGRYIDVVEIHWYWKHGEATFDTWKDEIPMNTINKWYPQGLTYKEEIKHFYTKCAELGYDHIKLGSLEWNVGPNDGKNDSGTTGDGVPVTGEYPTKYENTIMQAEMLMQFIDGGLEVATMWPIFWPVPEEDVDKYNANRYLMDPQNNYEFSPSKDMFTMLSEAQGKNKYEATSSEKTVYPLVVESTDKATLIAYTHSKSPKGMWVHFKTAKYTNVLYEVLKPTSATDRVTGAKETQAADAVTYNDDGGYYIYYIPAYSLGLLKLTK